MALIPKEVFDYFEKNYFQKYINDGVCQKFNTQGYDVLGCKKIQGEIKYTYYAIFFFFL